MDCVCFPPDAANFKDYEFDGKTYVHTDDKGAKHKWDLEKKEWVKVEMHILFDATYPFKTFSYTKNKIW